MEHNLLHYIEGNPLRSAAYSFFIMIFLAFIPAVPIPVMAGAIGMALGFWPALFINWLGSTVGAVLMFLGARYLFQKQVHQYLSRHQKTEKMIQFFEKNAFIAILLGRLLPIFPSILINLAASVTKISASTFFFATLLGKLPTMITFTVAGNKIQDYTWETIILVILYIAVIILLAKWSKKKFG